MKTLGLILCIGLWIATATAQPDTTWTRWLNLPPATGTVSSATLLANGESMIAVLRSTSQVINLWRLSNFGETVWQGTITTPSADIGMIGMTQMDEGHLIIAFVTRFPGQGQSNWLVLKGFTTTGIELWETQMEFDLLGYGGGFRKLSDNTVAAYVSHYQNFETAQTFVVNVSSDGDSLSTLDVGPGGAAIYAYGIAELSGGDLVVTGWYFDFTWRPSGYVARATRAGNEIWMRRFAPDGQSGFMSKAIDVDDEDHILVGGYDTHQAFSTPWAQKLDAQGEVIWSLTEVEQENCTINGVRLVPDGAELIGTSTNDIGANHINIYSVDATGAAALEARFDQSLCYVNAMNNFDVRGAIAFGTILDEAATQYGFILRFGANTYVSGVVHELDSNAPVPSARVEMVETGEFAVTDAEGGYLLGVGQLNGTIRVTSPCTTLEEVTVELDEGTENTLNFTVGVPEYDNPVSSLNMIASSEIAERETLVVSNFGNGDLIFSTTVHEQTPVYGWLSASPESGVIAPGETAEVVVTVLASSEQPFSELFGEVHIHHSSCPDTVNEVGVFVLGLESPEHNTSVNSFAMHAAYPNPFNNSARVAFDLPQTAQVNAKLYSIDGREAATLTNAQYTAGRHELTIQGDALATGVYLLRLTAGSAVATQKLVLLK